MGHYMAGLSHSRIPKTRCPSRIDIGHLAHGQALERTTRAQFGIIGR